MGGKEGSIGGDDFIGDKSEKFGDFHQDMKDAVVKILPQTVFEVGEGSFTGDIVKVDSGIKTVMPSPFPISDHLHEGLHIRKLFDIPKEVQDKKAYGIVGDSRYGVPMGDQRADEGKIYQGGNESCESSLYSSVRMDADVPSFITVFR